MIEFETSTETTNVIAERPWVILWNTFTFLLPMKLGNVIMPSLKFKLCRYELEIDVLFGLFYIFLVHFFF
jgi:hypothetical protein